MLGMTVLAVPALLAACADTATVSEAAGPRPGFVMVDTTARAATGSSPTWAQSSAEIEERVRALIHGKTIGPETAVQVALINNRALQAAFADLGLAATDLWEVALGPNPSLGGTISGIGEVGIARSVEAAVVGSLLELATRNQRRAIARTVSRSESSQAPRRSRAISRWETSGAGAATWVRTIEFMRTSVAMCPGHSARGPRRKRRRGLPLRPSRRGRKVLNEGSGSPSVAPFGGDFVRPPDWRRRKCTRPGGLAFQPGSAAGPPYGLEHLQFVVGGDGPARRHLVDVALGLKLNRVAEALQEIACLGADPAAPVAVLVDPVNHDERDAVRRADMRLRVNAQVRQVAVGSPQGTLGPAQAIGRVSCMERMSLLLLHAMELGQIGHRRDREPFPSVGSRARHDVSAFLDQRRSPTTAKCCCYFSAT
ncbi:Copper tolerance protein [Salipiger abyssi]|uniref:Copper tolerance protein n=2 Tax=Salipiger abyssi TaxID=1250539 RepID=A0A1P8UP62_9RHOB|nr:Copper tolerance protein [Salipiger abyssi]